jgi:hypothetical protein
MRTIAERMSKNPCSPRPVSLAMLFLALGPFGACSEDAGVGDLPPPDVTQVLVYYPLDRTVRGLGSAGSVVAGTERVAVKSYPTNTETLASVAPDGSFEFRISAASDDVLELRASNVRAERLGPSTFIRVPPSPLPSDTYVCCQDTRTCQSKAQLDIGRACPSPDDPLATTCTGDEQCAILGVERLQMDASQLEITPPNAEGQIQVTGQTARNSLVVLENRGLRAIGGPDAGIRLTTIANSAGRFQFRDIRAQGDDELVLKARDLLGFESAELAKFVPDAAFAGVDVVGTFDFDPLTPGAAGGKVAIRIVPYGEDNRGICPDSNDDPLLCFSGGLTYDMVNIRSATWETSLFADPRPVPGDPSRGTDGDVRAGPQDVMLVMEIARNSEVNIDSGKERFALLESFVNGLRSRDSAGLVIAGLPPDQTPLVGTERASLADRIGRLDAQANLPDEKADILAAIRSAANILRTQRSPDRSSYPGRIVVVVATDTSPIEDANRTNTAVLPDPDANFPGYVVDVIAINPSGGNNTLETLAEFSGGTYRSVNKGQTFAAQDLNLALSDARAALAGSFVLLYTMDIPLAKIANLNLTVDVTLGRGTPNEITKTATFNGPILIRNAPSNL